MRYAHSLGSMSSAKMDGKLKEPLDYINMVLQIVEHLLSWSGPENENAVKMPYLVIDSSKKTQRAYIVKNCQIVSFAFPFQVYQTIDSGTGMQQSHVRCKDLDISSAVISKCRVLYNDYVTYRKIMAYHEVASAQNLTDAEMLEAIRLFEMLMMMEPAYVRYDYDPGGVKGIKHPLCHFDYNYIEGNHYKIGLHSRIGLSHLEDMVSKDSDCWYVAKYKESAQEVSKRLKNRLGFMFKKSKIRSRGSKRKSIIKLGGKK